MLADYPQVINKSSHRQLQKEESHARFLFFLCILLAFGEILLFVDLEVGPIVLEVVVVHVLHQQPALQIAVLLVKDGRAVFAFFKELHGFVLGWGWNRVFFENLPRHAKPEHVGRRVLVPVNGLLVLEGILDVVVDVPFGQVAAVQGDVEAGAALAEVDLKELVNSVAAVVLDVKVGHPRVVDLFQKGLHGPVELLVIVRRDHHVVADGDWVGIFQKRVSQTHHLDLVILVHIGVQDPHVGVIARDKVLQDQVFLVAVGVDLAHDVLEFGKILNDEGLLAAFKLHVQPGNRIFGLKRDREGEGHVFIRTVLVVLHGNDVGLWIWQTVLLADLIEAFFGDQLFQQVIVNVGHDKGLLQFGLVLGQEFGVAVPARDQNDRLRVVLVFLDLVAHDFNKGWVFRKARVDLDINDVGVAGRSQGGSTPGLNLDSVSFMEGARHPVDVDVAAQQNWGKWFHCLFDSF